MQNTAESFGRDTHKSSFKCRIKHTRSWLTKSRSHPPEVLLYYTQEAQLLDAMNTPKGDSYMNMNFCFQLFPVSNMSNWKNSNKIQRIATTDIRNLISAQTREAGW